MPSSALFEKISEEALERLLAGLPETLAEQRHSTIINAATRAFNGSMWRSIEFLNEPMPSGEKRRDHARASDAGLAAVQALLPQPGL